MSVGGAIVTLVANRHLRRPPADFHSLGGRISQWLVWLVLSISSLVHGRKISTQQKISLACEESLEGAGRRHSNPPGREEALTSARLAGGGQSSVVCSGRKRESDAKGMLKTIGRCSVSCMCACARFRAPRSQAPLGRRQFWRARGGRLAAALVSQGLLPGGSLHLTPRRPPSPR